MLAELYKFEGATPYPPHSGVGATARHKQNMTANKLTTARRATPRYVPEVFQFEVTRQGTTWVFDDNAKGVQNEPFVCGMNEIIDDICRRFDIPAVDGQRIRATFCDERAIHSDDVKFMVAAKDVAWLEEDPTSDVPAPPNYTPYRDLVGGRRGQFCPVFRAYFPVEQTPMRLLLLPEKVGP